MASLETIPGQALNSAHHGETPADIESEFKGSVSGEDDFIYVEGIHRFYEPIEAFEGKHRFDPKATWTADEETPLVRKLDFKVMMFACLMFFALQLDRGNISSALSDGMLADLGITTDEFNNGMSIFYCAFLFMELPSQMISKRVGADRWIPLQIIAWSIVSISQSRITNKSSFYVTRALLGACEGGMIPDTVLWLSYFYTGDELQTRLSWFWATLTGTNMVQAFMAYALLHLRGHRGWTGWQYLFLIEGFITFAIGVFALFYLPPSPTQTNFLFKRFSEREEIIMVNRVLRDDPTKGDMHNRQGLSWKDFKSCLTDYDNWPLYAIGITAYIPFQPPQTYLTLTLRSLGFNTFNTNLLVIPSSFFFVINCLALSWMSRRVQERTFISLVSQLWGLPLLIALVTIPDEGLKWARFAITSLLVSYPYCHPILVAWNSVNSGSVRLRSVSASLYNISVQLGSIISTQVYRTQDGPYYHTGNVVLLAILCVNIVMFVAIKVYFVRRNAQKAAIWNAMNSQQRYQYLSTTKDSGNRRLDFVFQH